MNESISEIYYKKLIDGENKVSVLTQMFCKLFNITETPSPSFYGQMGRLINIYGADNMYFCILDCAEVNDFNYSQPFKLISYFAKKRLESKFNFQSINDLSEIVNKNKNSMERAKKLKAPKVFDNE